MNVLTTLLLLLLFSSSIISAPISNFTDKISVLQYLEKYGYYNDSNTSLTARGDVDALKIALALFQEHNNLTIVDGAINNETIHTMQKPRCGMPDSPFGISEFRTHTTKWNKTNLTWYFYRGDVTSIFLADIAFKFWELDSNLKFTKTYGSADIVISYAGKHHNFVKCENSAICKYDFDGKGYSLAHAYYPIMDSRCLEIHIDNEENWYFGEDTNIPDGKHSLLFMLIHEIGHTLGLSHSSNPEAIMYPSYNLHGDKIKLHEDDINGIQSLYGLKNKYAIIPKIKSTSPSTTTTTATATTKASTTKFDKFQPKSLCDVQFRKNIMYLVLKNKLYIIYQKWVWVLDIKQNKLLSNEPIPITNYIRNLPDTQFDAIYQRPNGDLVLFIAHVYYIIEFPGFKIKSSNIIDHIGLNSNNHIQAAFTTYTGKTYIFYDKNFYAEIDECSFYIKKHGLIVDEFVGIPQNVDNAFRYTNGMLYFLQKGTYFEYNEFTKTLIKTGKTSELFTIVTNFECPNTSILEQLKKLLSKLLNSNVQMENTPLDDDYEDN